MTEPIRGGQRGFFEDGPPVRGMSDLVALALVVLDLDVVRRSTLYALCPSGRLPHRSTGEPTKHPAQEAVRRALKRFDHAGLIRREGDFVHVLDPGGLRSWIDQGADVSEDRARSLLTAEEAARKINADLEAGVVVPGWNADAVRRDAEIRRRELIALQRLMQAAPNSAPVGRRSVRIVPRGRVL